MWHMLNREVGMRTCYILNHVRSYLEIERTSVVLWTLVRDPVQ